MPERRAAQSSRLLRRGRAKELGTIALLLSVGTLTLGSTAHAERNLHAGQSAAWVGTHLGVAAGLMGGSVAIYGLVDDEIAPRWTSAPAWERDTQQNFSAETSRLSDTTLVLNQLLPLAGLGASGSTTAYGNALVIYSESLAASFFLNTSSKFLFRRARPYLHGRSAPAQRAASSASVDSTLSFYSGHASMAFAAAVGGSYLVSATSESLGFRGSFWGLNLGLATLTSHLRVRAGRHYPSDVLVGGAMGAGLAIAIPLLHDVPISPQPAEYGAMAGGVLTGYLLGYLAPKRMANELAEVSVMAQPEPGGAQLQVLGRF